MQRAVSTVLTGAAITMAVGGAAWLLNDKKRQRKLKKNAAKAVKQVGQFVNSMSYMLQ